MEKIKVVIVIPSLVVGGAENMVCQLSRAINRDKFDIVLVSLSSKQDTIFEKILLKSGINIAFMDNDGGLSVQTAFKLWRYFNQFKPDIVHSHLTASLYAIPWVYTHKATLLHTIHTTPQFEFSKRIIGLMKILYKKKKAIPVAISNKIKVSTSSLYNISQGSIEVVYNPVDIERFRKKSINHAENIQFIHVGRMNPNKNQQLIIKAFAIVKKELLNVSLVLVGDGESKNELSKLVEDLNLNKDVTFVGNIANVEDYLNESDIFVLSSHYEGLPLSILEAMSSGLPIVSTNVGGVSDIVDKNGILIEDNDLNALTNSMLRLAKDKDLRIKMSIASVELSKQYNITNIAHKYEELYEKYSIKY